MPENPASSESALPRKIAVSIVEDDFGVREILRDWLNDENDLCCLSTFADGESAVDAMPSAAPDVALVDINLPRMTGIECVRRLKTILPNTQFVMLTVYEDAGHIFEALAAGASGYLQKRTPREGLASAIREVHAGGSPLTGNIARLVVESFQRSAAPEPATEGLSKRENEVLDLIARGYLYKEVADQIGISLPTVKTYIRRICEKLHVHSRAQAVAKYTNIQKKFNS